MVRPIVALAVVSLAAGPGLGCATGAAGRVSGPQTDWNAVMALPRNGQVDVTLPGGRIRGVLLAVDAATLRVDRAGAPTTIARKAIRRVRFADESRIDSLRNGAVWGAAVGLAYVAVVLGIMRGGDDAPSGGTAAVMAATGGGLGAAVGALIDAARRQPQWRTVYRQP